MNNTKIVMLWKLMLDNMEANEATFAAMLMASTEFSSITSKRTFYYPDAAMRPVFELHSGRKVIGVYVMGGIKNGL
jgi:hypothetical protein